MSNTILSGHVSFVNHEKKYIIIEYDHNGKKKVVNGSVDEKLQQKLKDQKLIKKKHVFHIGDTVSFTIALSSRGDKMVASNIQYLYNTALDVLINKAKTENNFIGYLKIIDDKYYVKEIGSYLFFPVPFSPWQIKRAETELNEAVTFALENLENKEKITAKLFNNNYIPEFYAAVKLHKANTPIEATVYKITPHGIYVNIVTDKIQAKIPLTKNNDAIIVAKDAKIGDKIKVVISYLSPAKIIVKQIQ